MGVEMGTEVKNLKIFLKMWVSKYLKGMLCKLSVIVTFGIEDEIFKKELEDSLYWLWILFNSVWNFVCWSIRFICKYEGRYFRVKSIWYKAFHQITDIKIQTYLVVAW